MKSKINIFRLIFKIITNPISFVKNLCFWYKIDKRKKVEYKAWLKTRKSNKQKWDLINTNIQNKLKNKDYIEDQELIKNTYNCNILKETLECELRNILNLNCERTINEDFLKRSISDIKTPDFEVDIDNTGLPMRYNEDYENNLKNLTEF